MEKGWVVVDVDIRYKGKVLIKNIDSKQDVFPLLNSALAFPVMGITSSDKGTVTAKFKIDTVPGNLHDMSTPNHKTLKRMWSRLLRY